MTNKDIYRLLLFLNACCYSFSTQGQIIKVQLKQEFYTGIYQTGKVFLKKEDSSNAIIYTDAIHNLFLIKDSLHWKGYLFRNTTGPEPTGYVTNENGDTLIKPINTVLYHFNGDSLYNFLYTHKLYFLKQFSDEQIADLYAKKRKAKKGIRYVLPSSSHDSDLSIKIPGRKNNIIYRWSLVGNKDLHFIPTLKTFFLLRQILNSTY